MEIIELIQCDHDNMENHAAYREFSRGLFTNLGSRTAHGVISDFIANLQPFQMYLGYDGEVYPKFKLVKREIHGPKLS